MSDESKTAKVIVTADEAKEVVLRQGEAERFIYPNELEAAGTLRAPFQFINGKISGAQMGRPEGMNFDYAHTDETTIYHPRRSTLFVDQKAGKLELWLNEKSPEGDVITGRLTLSDAAKDFKLNEGAMFNLQDVIKIVKRNKFKFADAAQHGDFLINLQNFNAKVTATIKHVREQSGSSVDFIEKVVAENKHSPSFQLNVPIYEGYPKRVITVQTCLEASSSSIQFYFESVDLFELIDKDKEEAIAAELALFTEHFPCSVVHQS